MRRLADVQLVNGYIRIANELMDEIIRRDFTKRQVSILHLLIRMSYGCQQKDCAISKLNLFELAGVYKTDIRKELLFLKNAQVINWEQTSNIFSLNKDYEKWQITPFKGWDQEKYDSLIHDNLARKKVSKTLTFLNLTVSKTLTELGVEVSETLTSKLVKHLLRLLGNTWESKSEAFLKDSIKDIYLKTKDDDIEMQSNPVTEYEKAFGFPTSLLVEEFNYWIDSEESQFQEPEAIICETIQRAKQQIPRNPAKYITKILKDLHNMELFTLDAVKAYNERFDKQRNGEGDNRDKKYTRRTGRTPAKNQESITGGKIGRL